jgi:quercetin dioxygenase-like cupin family protein
MIENATINSPEVVSPEIYNVVGDYDDFIVMMVVFEPGKSDKMHYHGNLLYYVIEGGLMQITLTRRNSKC